jgi:hypothetical protein
MIVQKLNDDVRAKIEGMSKIYVMQTSTDGTDRILNILQEF